LDKLEDYKKKDEKKETRFYTGGGLEVEAQSEADKVIETA